jgi:hypothetical protein
MKKNSFAFAAIAVLCAAAFSTVRSSVSAAVVGIGLMLANGFRYLAGTPRLEVPGFGSPNLGFTPREGYGGYHASMRHEARSARTGARRHD